MKFVLMTVGKPHAFLAQGIEDYLGRLKPYGGARLLPVRAARAGKNTPVTQIMAQEGQRLLERLDPRDRVWALDQGGKLWTSQDWARGVEKARLDGCPSLVLVIGGALGLDKAMLERADAVLSLGRATMAHELAALVAAEQIYRACTIVAGTPYHRQ